MHVRSPEGARTAPSVVAPVLVALITLSGCGGESEADADRGPAPAPVRTTPMEVVRHSSPVRTSGTVASRSEMDLAFKVPGYVAEVLVSEGERVSADQVLARLRSEEVDAEVRARAAQAERAASNLERMRRLFADSVVTESRLEEAVEAHESAQAALEVARFNRSAAVIRAPAAGRVLGRMIEPAEFVGAGRPVLRLGATDSGWIVRIGVSDRDVARLSVGDSATVRLPALRDRKVAGRVSEIADAADPRSGTFDVEVRIETDDPRLRSGMIGRVTVIPSGTEEISFLPSQAVVDGDGLDAAVFVVDGDTVGLRPVRVVRIGADSIGVHAPELEGAVIVTDGSAYLREGERVEDRTDDLPPLRN